MQMIQVCNLNKEKESHSAEETIRGCGCGGGANQTPSTLKGKTRVARMRKGDDTLQKKRFALNEMFQRNASKFAIFYA